MCNDFVVVSYFPSGGQVLQVPPTHTKPGPLRAHLIIHGGKPLPSLLLCGSPPPALALETRSAPLVCRILALKPSCPGDFSKLQSLGGTEPPSSPLPQVAGRLSSPGSPSGKNLTCDPDCKVITGAGGQERGPCLVVHTAVVPCVTDAHILKGELRPLLLWTPALHGHWRSCLQ